MIRRAAALVVTIVLARWLVLSLVQAAVGSTPPPTAASSVPPSPLRGGRSAIAGPYDRVFLGRHELDPSLAQLGAHRGI